MIMGLTLPTGTRNTMTSDAGLGFDVLGTKLKQLRPLQRLCIEGNTPLAVTPNAGDELGNALRNASERLSNLFELRVTLNDEAEPSRLCSAAP